jgi:type VI secretion system secreted protein VgrG
MKKLKNLTILIILTTLFVMVVSPSPVVLASPDVFAPDLGSAASFVALASSTLTNTGPGFFIGNVGVSPGSAVVGILPGNVINGSIHAGDSVAALAQTDATTAYNDLAGEVCNVHLTGQDLGGMTLTPGVYCFDTSAQLTGALVLDALGNSNAVWVFQTGSTLTTASASSVTVINGGNALNVFWQVGSSATLGTTTRFKGNILADASITSNTGASLIGRALALNGAVTLNTNGTPFPISNNPLAHLIYVPFIILRTTP